MEINNDLEIYHNAYWSHEQVDDGEYISELIESFEIKINGISIHMSIDEAIDMVEFINKNINNWS